MAIRFESDVLSQGKWAANLTELAAILGCARRSITRWKKLPDVPKPAPDGRHDVAAWRGFMRRNGLEVGSEDGDELELGSDATAAFHPKTEFEPLIFANRHSW